METGKHIRKIGKNKQKKILGKLAIKPVVKQREIDLHILVPEIQTKMERV